MTTATDTNTERIARLEGAYEHLATKADLAQMELRLTQEMSQMTQEMTQMESRLTQEITQAESRMAQETSRLTQDMAQLETRMAQLESRMTWRLIGAAGVIIAAVGLMVRFL